MICFFLFEKKNKIVVFLLVLIVKNSFFFFITTRRPTQAKKFYKRSRQPSYHDIIMGILNVTYIRIEDAKRRLSFVLSSSFFKA